MYLITRRHSYPNMIRAVFPRKKNPHYNTCVVSRNIVREPRNLSRFTTEWKLLVYILHVVEVNVSHCTLHGYFTTHAFLPNYFSNFPHSTPPPPPIPLLSLVVFQNPNCTLSAYLPKRCVANVLLFVVLVFPISFPFNFHRKPQKPMRIIEVSNSEIELLYSVG